MDGFEFAVEVVRTDRKRTVAIQLEGQGVRVRVPKNLPEARIRELLTKRSGWIERKLREMAAIPAAEPRQYVSGEAFPYLGRDYRLQVLSGGQAEVRLQGDCIEVSVPATHGQSPEAVRAVLLQWYLERAWHHLQEKTAQYAGLIGVSPQAVKVRSYKARWGSCSVKGDISYNWRIVLAPHRVVDYLVVHELCHLLEHNHSARYWRHVQRHMPDYPLQRNWLKLHGARLLAV